MKTIENLIDVVGGKFIYGEFSTVLKPGQSFKIPDQRETITCLDQFNYKIGSDRYSNSSNVTATSIYKDPHAPYRSWTHFSVASVTSGSNKGVFIKGCYELWVD